ncbi:MAG TPA: MFS transporter [Solirubrobacteraceae bacterium]|nr:MFS transporter [Solirubrobacteraceae bacterium]
MSSVSGQTIRGSAAAAARRLLEEIGGPIRLRVIVLFAGVYGLSSADIGTVGSVAPQLERALHISNLQIGLIAAVAAFAGALGTIPAGLLTDRVNRINLLAASIVLWSVTQLAGALAPSFGVLLVSRLALGAVTATAGPAIASLTGDYFPAGERARMLGLILTGELVGAGIGLVVSGDLGAALSWRYGFGWLALPGILLAVAIWRLLVEPDRSGQSQLDPGAMRFATSGDRSENARRKVRVRARRAREEALETEQLSIRELARRRRVRPHRDLILRRDPADMPLGRAIRYVLRVRTNLVLIVSTTLAYLFFAGIQTFAVLLFRARYGIGEGVATLLLLVIGSGAFLGLVGAGALADHWLARGRLAARVLVGAIAYIAAVAMFVPALLSGALIVSVPLFTLGAAGLAAPDGVLNAARLDIMHPHLWGRAEGVRTVPYMLAFAVAPLLFGWVSDALGATGAGAAAGGGGAATHANGTALAYTFLIMLVPTAIAGVSLLWGARTYPRDVATAAASTIADRTDAAATDPEGLVEDASRTAQ